MICLDTNAAIALLNATSMPLRERLAAERAQGKSTAISAVVLFELRYGAAKSARPKENHDLINGFVAGPISILAFDSEDAEEAGDIRAHLERKGTPIGPYDILIAAQARRRDALLVTANACEFRRVHRLRWENWLA